MTGSTRSTRRLRRSAGGLLSLLVGMMLKLFDAIDSWRWQQRMRRMPLPAKLIEVIQTEGRWPRSVKLLERVIPARDLHWPDLYDQPAMKRETFAWLRLATGEEAERLGKIDPRYSPGRVDPDRVILIGDVDPDLPIALDYGSTPEQPCVLYFNDAECWVKAADSFEEFWARMNGEEVPPSQRS